MPSRFQYMQVNEIALALSAIKNIDLALGIQTNTLYFLNDLNLISVNFRFVSSGKSPFIIQS